MTIAHPHGRGRLCHIHIMERNQMTLLEEKRKRLEDLLRDLSGLAVAYSGGVDSTFLLRAAAEVLGRQRVLAVTAVSDLYPTRELDDAKALAAEIGVRHVLIETDELGIEGFAANPPDRCYHCKRELFREVAEVAGRHGFETIADGANTDDVADWRPGLRAAAELGVRSPLKEAGLTKTDIRAISRELGLRTWDKPAKACLASRFPYRHRITAEALERVAAAEEYLAGLGLRQYRVRHHGTTARIEVPPEEVARLAAPGVREDVVAAFKHIGYTYVTLDLEGYRSGSMNEDLPEAGDATGASEGKGAE